LSSGATVAQFAYQLDALGNRTRETQLDGSRTDYSYDALSRVTSEQHFAPGGAATGNAAYGYDGVGNLLNQTGSPGSLSLAYNLDAQLVSAGGTTFTNDAAGQRVSATTAGATTRYAWDARGRLTRVQPPTGAATDFAYDSVGIRQSASSGGGTVNYLV